MKKIIVWVVVIAVLVIGVWFWKSRSSPVVNKNISYEVDGMQAKYFGNEVKGDFNSDGLEDRAFIVTASGGGSGTFYYVVASLGQDDGKYMETNGVFLGDRIAPQTTEFKNGEIIANYADRKPSEPMTTPPSVGISKYLKVEGNKLIEVNN